MFFLVFKALESVWTITVYWSCKHLYYNKADSVGGDLEKGETYFLIQCQAVGYQLQVEHSEPLKEQPEEEYVESMLSKTEVLKEEPKHTLMEPNVPRKKQKKNM